MNRKTFSKILGSIALLLLGSTIQAQAPNYLWAKKGGSVNGITVSAVTVDANGNSYITGRFNRVVSIGGFFLDAGSGSGMFIAKYNANGVVQWATKAVGNDSILSTSIAVDSGGNIYVGGSFYAATFTMNSVTLTNSDASTTFQDSFVIKLDSNGTALWGDKYFSSSFGNDLVFDIDLDSDGNVFIVGGNHDTVTNSRNIFIEKVSSTGGFLWYKSVSGTATEYATAVAVDNSGNVFVSGIFNSPSIVFGTTTLSNTGGYDMFLSKYSNNGTLLWSKSLGNVNDISPEGMDTDNAGNLYLMGVFNSPSVTLGTTTLNNPSTGLYSYFLSRLNTDGNVDWAVRPNGATSASGGGSIVVDNAGNSFITGSFSTSNMVIGSTTLTNAGGRDVFFARYNNTGNAVWAKSQGGDRDESGVDIALGPNGNCHLVGNFLTFSLTFGSTVLTNQGNSDLDSEYFLTKLDNTSLSTMQTDLASEVLRISPNPAKDYFELSPQINIEKVEIYSILGQRIKVFSKQNFYEVSDLTKGTYLVKVTSDAGTETLRMLVN